MINNNGITNNIYISGEIISDVGIEIEQHGNTFYNAKIKVVRLSGTADILTVIFPERVLKKGNLHKGAVINAVGQVRTHNKHIDGKSKLIIYIFLLDVFTNDTENHNENSVVLSGYVCKEPKYRTTPFGREVTDIIFAVNRGYKKSDYIPCIAWGTQARFTRHLAVGEPVAMIGRLQSREYTKQSPDGEEKTFTAYELSISRVFAREKLNNFDFSLAVQQKENYYTGA